MRALVVTCDRAGRILGSLPLGGGIDGVAARERTPFAAMFGAGSLTTALDLLSAVGREDHAVDWPLAAGEAAGSRTLFVSGARGADRFVFALAEQPEAVGAVAEAFDRSAEKAAIPGGEEAARLLGRLARVYAPPVEADSVVLFDEMARLNSELANSQRATAKANAELGASNALNNQLIGMLAHDLRTPLQVIAGFAVHLKERLAGRVDDVDLTALERIRESSQFMRYLVDNALAMAAARAGKLHLDRQPTDLAALIRRNADMNGVIARGKSMVIDLDLAPGVQPVAVDAPKMEQVLTNLLTNAIKFSKRGGRVGISLRQEKGRVVVAVRDHGRGIAAERLDALFQPFSRAAGTSGTAGEASVGLGLYICRVIVEGHGGTIRVESAPGQGSVFFVELPVGVADAGAAQAEAAD